MNFKLLVLFALISLKVSSQEDYHFDNYVILNVKNYKNGYNGKLIEILNHKDSTYILQIQEKIAFLTDYSKKKLNIFQKNFDFKKLTSIKKLDNAYQTYNPNITNKKVISKGIEIMEYENDTVQNTKIIHLTQYKDQEKNLILSEHYYFFSLKKEMNFDESTILKIKFKKKFNIEFKEDENLYKILSLKDGKIIVDTEFLSFVNEEVDFKFDVNSQQTKNIFIQQRE